MQQSCINSFSKNNNFSCKQMRDKLIISDLDETLIHATTKKLDIDEDFVFETFFVYNRPFLTQFLQELNTDFKIGIWSSATEEYISHLVSQIKPKDVSLEVVWARDRCSFRCDMESDTYIYEKRLDKLKKLGFKMEQILVVDDTHEKSWTNYGNAIYIKEFCGNQNDEELKYLLNYLRTLKDQKNVRVIEKRGWRKI